MTMTAPGTRVSYVVDPDDPRAPPTEVWNRMTPEERMRVVEALPSDSTLDFLPPPEGDRHFNSRVTARDTLGRHFQRVGRRVYVSGELPIYYPGERVFAADLIAVLDAEVRERDSWVTDLEGKGIDFALEVHVKGDRRKDMTRNRERYARLGIQEYFVFDRARGDLHGFRLPSSGARVYEKIPSRQGLLESAVLGLGLSLMGGRLRFLIGDAIVPDTDELLTRLGAKLDDVLAGKDEAERRALELEQKLAEERKGRKEERKRRKEEEQRRAEIERRLADIEAELARLKQSR